MKVPFSDFVKAIADEGDRNSWQTLSPMKVAADPQKHDMLRRIDRILARGGYSIDWSSNKPLTYVDLHKIDAALKQHFGQDTAQRMAIKGQLFACGLIPA